MGLFSKSEKPKTKVGDRRIERVTRNDGAVHYEVWRYDHGWESTFWQPEKSDFNTFEKARQYVIREVSLEEGSREVVWP